MEWIYCPKCGNLILQTPGGDKNVAHCETCHAYVSLADRQLLIHLHEGDPASYYRVAERVLLAGMTMTLARLYKEGS